MTRALKVLNFPVFLGKWFYNKCGSYFISEFMY